jgi:hypothetical protein
MGFLYWGGFSNDQITPNILDNRFLEIKFHRLTWDKV